MKPIKRSGLRIIFGKLYFTYKRCFEWYFGKKKYSKSRKESEEFKYSVFRHSTPLIRKLKNLDQYLQYNKVNNLNIAGRKINNIIIYPGETFSYWKLIGKTTKRKGYMEGLELFYGTLRKGIGGGLCQLSNMIYWMALHTPLNVTERYRHTYDVFPDSNRKLPFGSGATCVYNYRDLQIYNPTETPYQIKISVSNDDLIGEFFSIEKPLYHYEIHEENHIITHEYWGGYIRHNSLNRKIFDNNNNLINDEFITENHALMMYQPFLSEKSQN